MQSGCSNSAASRDFTAFSRSGREFAGVFEAPKLAILDSSTHVCSGFNDFFWRSPIVLGNKHLPCQVNIVVNILALGFGNFGGPDVFIILLIVLILFGAKKLPDLARSLGQSMNEFKKAREDIDRELHEAGKSTSAPSSSSNGAVQEAPRS
jgi:sec-independent protein translocase protein TatA